MVAEEDNRRQIPQVRTSNTSCFSLISYTTQLLAHKFSRPRIWQGDWKIALGGLVACRVFCFGNFAQSRLTVGWKAFTETGAALITRQIYINDFRTIQILNWMISKHLKSQSLVPHMNHVTFSKSDIDLTHRITSEFQIRIFLGRT